MPTSSLSATLQTPHSGYHAPHLPRQFFEGWYLRLTLPGDRQSAAFMYAIDPNPSSPHRGGTAQVLGPDEGYLCRSFPQLEQFWAWRHGLGLGHGRSISSPVTTRPDFCPPEQFESRFSEGYQLTATHHQGHLYDPRGDRWVRWCYQVQPVYGWGDERQQSTAGWLSSLPVFEPGWQILMAHGLATGWLSWGDRHYAFSNAPAYAEKNWGGAFPQEWFWIQCNAFEGMPDLALTAGGGRRGVLWWEESVGLIGLHHQGRFYEFGSRRGQMQWRVSPWGYWWLRAERDRLRIELVGTSDRPGTCVRVPTAKGMAFRCRDTTHGHLQLRLWEQQNGTYQLQLQAHSHQAGLEVGGPQANCQI